MRELPRFNTVIANAYVQPLVSDYLGRLVAELRRRASTRPVFLMHSGGGLVSRRNRHRPARAVPGIRPCWRRDLCRRGGAGTRDRQGAELRHGRDDRQDLPDRGVARRRPANTFEVARTYRFKKGSGMLISTPVVEMVEIGAGGGSLAWVDAWAAARRSAFGGLRTGPRLLRARR
jgi:N-methylhydantoinase A